MSWAFVGKEIGAWICEMMDAVKSQERREGKAEYVFCIGFVLGGGVSGVKFGLRNRDTGW